MIFDTKIDIISIETRLLGLELQSNFVSSNNLFTARPLVVVKIISEQGTGWGECSALPERIYSDETAQSCFDLISTDLANSLIGKSISPYEFVENNIQHGPMSVAGVEMALIDISLKAENIGLAEALGSESNQIQAGAVIGISESRSPIQLGMTACVQNSGITANNKNSGMTANNKNLGMTACVQNLAELGYSRIKLKIQPDFDLQQITDLTSEFPKITFDVDANASFLPEQFDQVSSLFNAGIKSVEQPFHISDIDCSKRLVKQLSSGQYLIADESAIDLNSVKKIVTNNTANAVAIKPAKFGGIQKSLEIYKYCLANDVAMVAGGMIESGLGRNSLTALATLPGFTLVGDVSPVGLWIKKQPWQDLDFDNGTIKRFDGPGIAKEPDIQLLDAQTKSIVQT